MVYPRRGRGCSDGRACRSRSGLSGSWPGQTQGTRGSEKEIAKQVTSVNSRPWRLFFRRRPKVQYQTESFGRRLTTVRKKTAMKSDLSKLLVLILICAGAATQSSLLAATIPAGTPLIVRTAGGISSHATPGRAFTA